MLASVSEISPSNFHNHRRVAMNNKSTLTRDNIDNVASPSAAVDKKRCSDTFFQYFTPLTRCWGVFTAIVLCGVGVDLTYHNHNTGIYIICGSAVVLILETIWVGTLFIQICTLRREHGRLLRCWSVATWLEGWKKSLLYAPMGAVPLVWPHNLWLSYVASGQLIALAVFHVVLSFKGRRKRRRGRRKERLLHGGDVDSFESSKFEEITDILDDGFPEPIPGSSVSLSDSLAVEQHLNVSSYNHQQDTILEI